MKGLTAGLLRAAGVSPSESESGLESADYMQPIHARNLVVVLGLAAVAALALFASGTAAAPLVQHYHFAFTCTFPSQEPCPVQLPAEQCGIPGTTVEREWGNVQVFADGTSKMELKETYTFTSSVTGKSFESRSAAQLTNNTVPIDNGDGTVSFVYTFNGLEQQLKLPNGPVLARDVGPVTFTLTFSAATGEFVSFGVSGEKGSHPLIESGGTLFCDVVVPALTDP
jgi:hypothetical protein